MSMPEQPDYTRVLLAHGSGGRLSHELVEHLFLKHFDSPILLRLEDSAVIGQSTAFSLAFTTDSYVVSPIFFPGGDIGKLAVCGTVNDLAMSGATPRYLSAGFILEEGLPLADLERVVASMAATAREADVQIVTGDTKVVDRGKADALFINTAGVGWVPDGLRLGSEFVRPGDVVVLSGTLGDHGMTIMTQREGLRFEAPLASDCAPLNGLVARMLRAASEAQVVGAIHAMRDPTRGGLATTLNEVAGKAGVGVEVNESAIPVRDAVRAACELLGLDPLYVANEGKLVAFVAPAAADAVLAAMRQHEYGR
ncbi:MAG: hydrogenase expression/formation protein HypE, partial [Anaerolineales bacterium]|nr:hydrogenase expression/formation protein HypE [Anaerolineales bacterium]